MVCDFPSQGRCPICRLGLNRLRTCQSTVGAIPGHVNRASQEAGDPFYRGQIPRKRRRRAQQGDVEPLQPAGWPHTSMRDFPVLGRRSWVPACHKGHLAHAGGRGRLALEPCHPIGPPVVTRSCHCRRCSGGQGDHRPRRARQADRAGGEGRVPAASTRTQAWYTSKDQEGCQGAQRPGGALFEEGFKTSACQACSSCSGVFRQRRWKWGWCQGRTGPGQGPEAERGVEAIQTKADHRWSSRSQPWRRGLRRRGRVRFGLERLHWVRRIRLCCSSETSDSGDTDGEQDGASSSQGYKRWFYRRLSHSAHSASGRHRRAESQSYRTPWQEEAIEEPIQEGVQGAPPPEGRWKEKEGQQEEKEKEKEGEEEEEPEEGDPFGWEDSELLFKLQEQFGREFIDRRGCGAGSTVEEALPETPWIGPEPAVGTHCRAASTVRRGGRALLGSGGPHFRRKGGLLPRPRDPTSLRTPSQGAQRDAQSGNQHRPASPRPASQAGRCPSRPPDGDPSVVAGRLMGLSQAFGSHADAGGDSPERRSAVGGEETWPTSQPGPGHQPGLADRQRKRKRQEGTTVEPLRRGARRRVVAAKRKRKITEERKAKERQGQGQHREDWRQVVGTSHYEGLAMAGPLVEEQTPLMRAGLEVFTQVLQHTTTLGELGCALGWLLARISIGTAFEFDKVVARTVFERCCRPQIVSARGAIFPLPSGALSTCEDALKGASLAQVVTPPFVERWQHQAWQFCVLVGLNAIEGKLQPLAKGRATKLQARAAAASSAAVQRFLKLGGRSTGSPDAIRAELKGIRISYTGEEMGTCHKLTRDQVVPALPPGSHGASVDVMTLLSPGTQRLLQYPENLIVKDVGQDLPPLQARVHCSQDELLPLCLELVQRQICTWIPLDTVFQFRQQPVLSGLFGVEKSAKLEDGRSVLRLIMNLVPINSVMEAIAGCVRHLPSITSWLGISTDADDRLGLFQSDLSSAFYLFRLPPQWTRFLAFNVKMPGTDLGLDDTRTHVLACRVIPMGWISSVALMQEVAEQVAYLGGAEEDAQISRGSSLPLFLTGCVHESQTRDRPWWHVYLDNFCSGQRVKGTPEFGKGHELHKLVEDVWARTGLVSSAKKRVSGALSAQELGAWIDGSQHTISSSGDRFIRLIHATLYLLSCRFLNKKSVQVIIGRWVHVLQFRRPLMGTLTHVWKFISTPQPSPAVILATRQELWKLTILSPLMHTFLGATIDDCTTASDASLKGGRWASDQNLV